MEAANAFERSFDVHHLPAVTSIGAEVAALQPDAICFDFDFPTKHGLKTLQEVKRDHASLPVIMLTVQHSESLAVWAFRSRAWDYLVKPLGRSDLQRCLDGLGEILSLRDPKAQPRKAAMASSTIPEENRGGSSYGHASLTLAPAITYVEQNYRAKLSSSTAASLCRLTTFQFSRLFRETYGLTFQEYMLRFRIREACRLLRNPVAQVTDVAHLVGFNDPSYFGKIFKRYTSVSPSQYGAGDDDLLNPEHLLEVLTAD